MPTNMTLRAAVLTKFRSVAQFADNIGWSYAKAYRVVNDIQNADAEDMRRIIEVLELRDAESICRVFSLL